MTVSPIACEKINLHDVRLDASEGCVGAHFLNSNLSSWRSMCKYYSGDVKCMPNKEVLARVTKVEALNWEGDFSTYPYPRIDEEVDLTRQNYRENLQICSLSNDDVEECEGINYEDYISDLLVGNDWYDATKDAKCTEIGYLHGLKCKRTGAGTADNPYKCTESNCAGLEMYVGGSVSDSINVCRSLGCAVDDASFNSCVNFENAGQFKFKELDNEGMSLGAVNAHCLSLGKVVDLSKYNSEKHNFEDEKDANVCTDRADVDISGITDADHCKEIGAINGFQAEFHKKFGCKKSETQAFCANVTFNINRFWDDQKNISSKIPVNAFYDNEYFSYGTQLCESIGCHAGALSMDNTTYTCGASCDQADNERTCALAVGEVCQDGLNKNKCFWDGNDCIDECPTTTSTDTNSSDTNSTDTTSKDTNSTDTYSTDSNSTDTNSTDTTSTDTTSTDTTSTGSESIVSFAMTLVAMGFTLCM